MIAWIVLAALTAAPGPSGPNAAPRAGVAPPIAAAADLESRRAGHSVAASPGSVADPARAPLPRDSVVALPEVRVEGARPRPNARTKLPTAFASDLPTGATGHALETLAEVLGQAAGVRIVQYGGLGAFSTVSLRGAPAGQVSVFLDGAPLTSAAHGVVNLSDLPASAVERIEVYRGLSPLSLGSATPGGAINFVTLVPRERLDVRLVRGSFDTWDGRATAGFGRGSLRAALHAGYQGSAGDFRYHDDNGTPLSAADDGISTRVNNRFEAASLLATLGFAPARGVAITAREELFRKAQGVPGLGAVPAYDASLRTLRSLTRLEVASAPRGAAPGGRLTGSLARERVQSRDRLGRLGLGLHDTDDRLRSDDLALALEWPGPKGVLSAEAAASLRRERASLHDAADGRPDPPASERMTRGASLALQLRPLRDRVVLHAARRWDRIEDRLRSLSSLGRPQSSDVTRQTETPQLGARIGVGGGFELRANWTRTERVPDFMELFGNQGSVLGNPTLQPERGESWDAGARWAGASASGFSAAAEWSHFESDTRDLILYIRSSQSFVRAQNVGRGVIRGEELSLGTGTPWGVAASASATLQEARDRGRVPAYYGKRLPQRPERQANARVEYARRRLTLGADLDYLGDNFGDQYNQKAKWVPSRTLVGAWLSVAPLGRRGFRVTFEGKNLGDRRVSDVGGFPLPGRSVFVSLEARLGPHD